jgi:hypothetical protein
MTRRAVALAAVLAASPVLGAETFVITWNRALDAGACCWATTCT